MMSNEFVDFDEIHEWNRVKDSIFLRLIPVKENERVLDDCVWESFLDLAIVPYSQETCISKKLLTYWGIDQTELMKTAHKNMRRDNPPSLSFIESAMEELAQAELVQAEELNDTVSIPILEDILQEVTEQPPTGYLTADQRFGAYYLADPDILSEFHEFSKKCGVDLIILPISVHGIIIEPRTNLALSVGTYQKMLQICNTEATPPEERLSDNVYLYLANQNQIVIAE